MVLQFFVCEGGTDGILPIIYIPKMFYRWLWADGRFLNDTEQLLDTSDFCLQ